MIMLKEIIHFITLNQLLIQIQDDLYNFFRRLLINEFNCLKDTEAELEVSLDTSHYRPDELQVHVEHGAVTVEGMHEEKSQDGKRVLRRQFKRK